VAAMAVLTARGHAMSEIGRTAEVPRDTKRRV
jgi:hypothetical protein